MLVPWDYALCAVLVAFFPLWAVTFGYRRLTRADLHRVPEVRRSIYRWAIAIQWVLAAVTLAIWVSQRRSWVTLGLTIRPTWGLLGIAIGLAVVLGFLRLQRQKARSDPETLEMVRERLGPLERMLPHDRHELRWFGALALTAGTCEELLYRGYLIWFLQHFMGLIPAAGLAAVIFGVGHAYQGPRGMLMTGAAGLFLGAVYLLSGSLLASMVIHAAMDLHTAQLAFFAFSAPAPNDLDEFREETATGEGMPEPPPAPAADESGAGA